MSKPLTVRLHEAGPRFLVQSVGSEEVEYLVDFEDLRTFPQGRCGCKDFQIRIESRILKQEIPERYSCKHCRACVKWMQQEIKRKRLCAS